MGLLTVLLKVSRCHARKYRIIIVTFELRSVLAGMQKNWSLFLKNLYYFCIVWSAVILVTYDF